MPCRVHKPGVPHGPAFQQKLGPADDVANNAQLLGQPKYLTTCQKGDPISDRKAWPRGTASASDSGPPLRPEGLAEKEHRSLPTPACPSDRKAWPRRNNARFRLRPVSPTERPGQRGTLLTSDSDPPLRSRMHRTSAYSSSPTGTVGAD